MSGLPRSQDDGTLVWMGLAYRQPWQEEPFTNYKIPWGRGIRDYCRLPEQLQLQQPLSLSRREQRGCGTICGDDLQPAHPEHWEVVKTKSPILSHFIIDLLPASTFYCFYNIYPKPNKH